MPIVSYNISSAAVARSQAAADRIWPADAPHSPADVKAKIWSMWKSMVMGAEAEAAKKALAEPADMPMDDGV